MKFMMNTLRKNTLDDKVFLFKESIISILIYYIASLFFLYLLILAICTYESTGELLSGVFGFGGAVLIGALFGFSSTNKFIMLDAKANCIIVSELGISSKKQVGLDEVVKIAIIDSNHAFMNMDKEDVLISIQLTDKDIKLTTWCETGRFSAPLFETRKMRRERYQKFADKVNAIIKERYPNNKPINYDESDE